LHAAEPASPLEPRSSRGQRSGHKILVVDDDADTADALAALLRLHGDAVRTAYDGKMAIELGRTFEPNVILLDIGMADMDGYEACRRIRAEEWGQGVHIIAVTGWGQDEHRDRTRLAGFDHHLVKPVDPTAMSVLLRGLDPRRKTPWPAMRGKARR